MRKLFDSYCHSVIRHSCQQYRIISGRSANTEKQKATSNSLKTFVKLKSNHHNDNILLNSLIRLQAKYKLGSSYSNTNSMETKFSSLYAPLKKVQQNTVISFSFLKKYCRDYQALLESIADYLIEGQGSWWRETEKGIEFFDSKNENIQKSIHHFRSTTMKEEEKWVQDCWLVCLDDKHSLIPAFKIYVDESEEELNTLNFFKHTSNTATTSISSHKIKTLTHSTIIQENLDGNAINTPAKVNKETVNLHMGRPKFEETSESPILEENEFCERKNSMLSFQKHDKILTSTPLQSTKKIETNQENSIVAFQSVPYADLSKTAELLKNLIGNDPLVHEFNKSRRILKLQKSAEDTENYKLIVAKLEVKLLSLSDKYHKKLNKLEMMTLTENNAITPKLSITENKEQYVQTINNLKLIKVLRKELKI